MATSIKNPERLLDLGNGSYRYRFNIAPTEVCHVRPSGEVETTPAFRFDEVTVWAPLTANKILKAVIEAACPASHEQKLVNDYNAATLGMLTGEKADAALAAYRDFLTLRQKIKEHVDADCAEAGVANA